MATKNEKIFDFAAKELRAEIDLYWRRSLFFWGFIAAAFVAYGVVVERHNKDLALAICCFGLVGSIVWTLANRGSKYWQDSWEQKLHSVEKSILGRDIYFKVESQMDTSWWGASRYSVSKLTIALSDFTVLVWFILGLRLIVSFEQLPSQCFQVLMIGLTAIYLCAIFVLCRGKARL